MEQRRDERTGTVRHGSSRWRRRLNVLGAAVLISGTMVADVTAQPAQPGDPVARAAADRPELESLTETLGFDLEVLTQSFDITFVPSVCIAFYNRDKTSWGVDDVTAYEKAVETLNNTHGWLEPWYYVQRIVLSTLYHLEMFETFMLSQDYGMRLNRVELHFSLWPYLYVETKHYEDGVDIDMTAIHQAFKDLGYELLKISYVFSLSGPKVKFLVRYLGSPEEATRQALWQRVDGYLDERYSFWSLGYWTEWALVTLMRQADHGHQVLRQDANIDIDYMIFTLGPIPGVDARGSLADEPAAEFSRDPCE